MKKEGIRDMHEEDIDPKVQADTEAFAAALAERAAKAHESTDELQSIDMLKTRLTAEYTELFLMRELKKELDEAVSILQHEGPIYLQHDEWQAVLADFTRAAIELQKPFDDEQNDTTAQERGKISRSTMDYVEEVAKKKFGEKEFQASSLLYTFLATLNPREFYYWFRLGISYQQQKEYQKALFAYGNATTLTTKSASIFLFMADCYFRQGEKEKAVEALVQAKEEIANENTTQWNEYAAFLEHAITTMR